jgi:glycine cleavage system H lipoate-binding protein
MVAILVVLTIIAFVMADLAVQWHRARKAAPAKTAVPHAGPADLILPALQPERFTIPAGVFFHRGHTWVNLLFSGQVKVGVDDFLQKLLGRIDAVTLPPQGIEVKAGQPFAVLHQGDRQLALLAPVSGVVSAVNAEAAKAPGLLKRDPYTRGWLVALQPKDLGAALPGLQLGERAVAWLGSELGRMRAFLQDTLAAHRDAAVGLTAADGGLTADGLLERVDDAAWADFEARFLRG